MRIRWELSGLWNSQMEERPFPDFKMSLFVRAALRVLPNGLDLFRLVWLAQNYHTVEPQLTDITISIVICLALASLATRII
jgi:hypothetical protein